MDIQLFATDEELQDFPETKTDKTVPDKTPKSNSINLAASDLPRSHSHLPRIPSRLPERKIRHKSRRDHRSRSRSNTKSSVVHRQAGLAEKRTHWQVNLVKNIEHRQVHTSKYTVDRQTALARKSNTHQQSAQPNDQLEFKQEIQSIGKPIPTAYLGQLVGRPVDLPPPSEAVLPGQHVLGSPEIAPPVARQLKAHQPVLRSPVLCPPVVRQPDRQVPSLLSLRLRPDLNALARTLSPQALRYVHLGIQIGQNLLN